LDDLLKILFAQKFSIISNLREHLLIKTTIKITRKYRAIINIGFVCFLVDPSRFQDCWRLSDGFVAAEAKTILPHRARSRCVFNKLRISY